MKNLKLKKGIKESTMKIKKKSKSCLFKNQKQKLYSKNKKCEVQIKITQKFKVY